MDHTSRHYFAAIFVAAAFLIIPLSVSAAKFQIKDGPQLDVWGFAQVVARQVDRQGGASNRDGLEFTEDRVRFGTKMKWGQWSGGLQFDANGNDQDFEGTLDDFIRDAFAAYQFSDAFQVKAGQFKTPVGMAFNMSGKNLPLLRRTMASNLVLDRTQGVMASGRYIGGSKEAGGFGYDIGVFNPAGRSRAYADTAQNEVGDDLSYAARLMYDYGKVFHLEASWGEIEVAGGVDAIVADNVAEINSEDYEVFDIGAVYKKGPFRIRAEYIDGEDIRGRDGWDEEAWFIEGGYKFTDIIEGVVRYQEAECDDCGGDVDEDFELNRFEIGLNLFLGQNDSNGRVQLYYASVGDDEEDYSGRAGASDNNLDMMAAQVQFAF